MSYNVYNMTFRFRDLINKYKIDDIDNTLTLKPSEKVEFLTDLDKIIKSINKIFDGLTNITSLRGGQILMSLAKLDESKNFINKADIQRCLNIDRREKLYNAFDYLEKQNYIKIIKKSPKFHIIKLNEKDNPELSLFKDIVKKYWISPEEKKKKAIKWKRYDK